MSRLAVLRMAELLRKRRKKKEKTKAAFLRDPFKFMKTFFTKEKSGNCQQTCLQLHDISPTQWGEVQEIVCCAWTTSAPGTNGIPYRVYKGAPDV